MKMHFQTRKQELFPAFTQQLLDLLSCLLGSSTAILIHSGLGVALGTWKGPKTFPPPGTSSIRECSLHPICYSNVIWMRHQTLCLLLPGIHNVLACACISLSLSTLLWTGNLKCSPEVPGHFSPSLPHTFTSLWGLQSVQSRKYILLPFCLGCD